MLNKVSIVNDSYIQSAESMKQDQNKDFLQRDIEILVRDFDKLHEYIIFSKDKVGKFSHSFNRTAKLRG